MRSADLDVVALTRSDRLISFLVPFPSLWTITGTVVVPNLLRPDVTLSVVETIAALRHEPETASANISLKLLYVSLQMKRSQSGAHQRQRHGRQFRSGRTIPHQIL